MTTFSRCHGAQVRYLLPTTHAVHDEVDTVTAPKRASTDDEALNSEQDGRRCGGVRLGEQPQCRCSLERQPSQISMFTSERFHLCPVTEGDGDLRHFRQRKRPVKPPEIDIVSSNRSGHRRGDQTQTNRIGVRMSDFLPQGTDLIYSSHRGVAVIIASIIDRWMFDVKPNLNLGVGFSSILMESTYLEGWPTAPNSNVRQHRGFPLRRLIRRNSHARR